MVLTEYKCICSSPNLSIYASDMLITIIADRNSILISIAVEEFGTIAFGLYLGQRLKHTTVEVIMQSPGKNQPRYVVCAGRMITLKDHRSRNLQICTSDIFMSFTTVAKTMVTVRIGIPARTHS